MTNQISSDVSRASWSPREFALRHGLSHPTIYAEMKAGRLGYMELGRRCKRITLEHEAKWLRLKDAGGQQGAA